MGWAPGDEEKVAKAKIALANAKNATYLLAKEVAEIKHPDKGLSLRKQVEHVLEKHFRDIEIELNR